MNNPQPAKLVPDWVAYSIQSGVWTLSIPWVGVYRIDIEDDDSLLSWGMFYDQTSLGTVDPDLAKASADRIIAERLREALGQLDAQGGEGNDHA